MADTFTQDLRRFADKTGETLEEVDVGFKLAILSDVVRNTRVDTGRMRGNWQVTTGSPAVGETGREQPTSIEVPPEEVAKIEPFSSTWITNNVPYAVVWEERDGMLGLALANAQANLRRVIDAES